MTKGDNEGKLPEMNAEDILRLERRIGALEDRLAAVESKPVTKEVATRGKRACRIPEGYMPSQETIDTIKSEFPNVRDDDLVREHRKFCDYWQAKATQATKRDWDGTWRNWMRRAFEQLGSRSVGGTVADKAQGWLELGEGK